MSIIDRVNQIDRERLQYRATQGSPFGKANPIIVYQVAHGLHFGDPLALSGSTYSKATNPFQVVVGMVWRVIDADHFIYVGAGGVVNGFSGLTPGSVDAFADYGLKPDWNESGSVQIGNQSVYAVAISATEKVILNNYIVVRGVLSQSLNCQIITTNAITDIGQVVGPYTLPALPNAALRSTSIVTGIVVDYLGQNYLGISMWLVISAGSWAVKVNSSHPLYLAGNGVKYLSDTVAGAWTAIEPNISVPIFTSSAYTYTDYPVPSSPPSYYVSIYPLIGAGYGAGIASLAMGGTGLDFTTINTNAVVFKYNATSLGGTLNAGALGVLTQVAAGQPIWNALDTNTFKQVGANLYGNICGKDIDNTAPTDWQLLEFSASLGKWRAFSIVDVKGKIPSFDGTSLVQVDASVTTSVLGNSTGIVEVPAAIQATADNFVLGRRGGVLTFAKVARAELADGSACSVIGRSSNSSGVTADITASADGQALQRIGGVVQFAALPSLSGAIGQYGTLANFGTNGTFTVPVGVTKIGVMIIGGGGGGGSVGNGSNSGYVSSAVTWTALQMLMSSGGGGGGAGGMVYVELSVTPGQTISYTVGTGGSAGSASDGGDGVDSSITWSGHTETAFRGLGGKAAGVSGPFTVPGKGGVGGTGNGSGYANFTMYFTGAHGGSGLTSWSGLGLGPYGDGGDAQLPFKINNGYGAGGHGGGASIGTNAGSNGQVIFYY